ncbi:hypothetical protein AK88_00024 [Plasmodium fragile]|uniref:Uncharacterized protein n=1 Tax=Plasmodium fragile TaxID=5857 RepID=A0A0D9QUC7_PLAFR|nr:uncharacterized protein AK88_00024 [Plasmodium fragile]KJP90176.1 hypothetical protein AK88_00024 [Plasmodium fragile]
MDIQEKLHEVKKLLELQTCKKDESRESLIKLMRELYLAYMLHRTEEQRSIKEKAILRLLLVHVDSENHTSNREKILMVNLIRLIEKDAMELFSCYPNIWKGNNSPFFFYILAAQHVEKNLSTSFFSLLKISNCAYKNMYIALLLFSSKDFETKMRCLKYVFNQCVLMSDGNAHEGKKEVGQVARTISFTEATHYFHFLVEENEPIYVERQMSCFFFSVINDLIRQDYVALLRERKRENDELRLKLLVKGMSKEKSKTKNKYVHDLILYTSSRNILSAYFNNNEDAIMSEHLRGGEQNLGKKQHAEESRKGDCSNGYCLNGEGSKKLSTPKRGSTHCNGAAEEEATLCSTIEKHYDVDFLRGIFLYVKSMINCYYDIFVKEKKGSSVEMRRNYFTCFMNHSITILIHICLLDNNFISSCYELIKDVKKKFEVHMNTSIIVPMAKFILFFSSPEKFFQVSNYLLTHFVMEFKSYLAAVTLFDFIMSNINILHQRKFFFKKFCSILLKTYFFHHHIFKHDLIALLPCLIDENNYKDVFYFLLYAPVLVDLDEVESTGELNSPKGGSRLSPTGSDLRGTHKKAVLIQDLSGLTLHGDTKNKRRMEDIRENMHKYFRAYFETVLMIGAGGDRRGSACGDGTGSCPPWRHELTKIILLRLACPDILIILNKESIKEMLKHISHSVRCNPNLLILLKDEFVQLLQNESSMYYHLVSEKVLQIVAENTKRMNITYGDIEKYYVTLHSFFSGGNYKEVKFWVSLIHAFTNIAVYCHDFAESVLRVYAAFLSRSDVTLMLKHIVTEHVGMIKNVSYAKGEFFS